MTDRLDGQIALVTGAGRGIGRAVAQALAEAGAGVALMARSTDQLNDACAAITAAGGRAISITGDVSSAADVQRAVDETQRQLGSISILVSNAGITGPFAPVWDADPEEWWRTQEVHLHGAFLCARGVWGGMVDRGGGRIIIISSRAAERGGANLSAYQIAKAGQLRLAEALGAEGAPLGIHAFAVHPGFVDTQFALEPLRRADAQKHAAPFVARLRALRQDTSLGTPINLVAELCVFLGSGRGDALSGRYLRVEEDWQEVVRNAKRIEQDDLYTLRLRTLQEPSGPPAPDTPPIH